MTAFRRGSRQHAHAVGVDEENIMRGSLIRAILVSAPLVLGGGIAIADEALSNKWRIEVSEGANNTGTLQFRLTPAQGSPVDVAATVREGRGENGVAEDIRDAFQAQLPADRFTVEIDDGEDVLVKKQDGQPDFALQLVQSTVLGTRVELDRE